MRLFILLSFVSLCRSIVHIQTVTLTQNTQTFTITFSQAFKNDASFAYFFESGNILSTEFAVTHDAMSTQATKTQLLITFVTHKAVFMAGQYIILSVIASDDNNIEFNFGVITLDIVTTTLTFTGFSLSYTNFKLEVYPLALPMSYTKTLNSNANQLVLTISQSPSTYFVQGIIFFAFIYITNAYAAKTPISLFPYITEINYGYVLSYANFAYTPSASNTLLAIKTFSSTSSPFFPLSTYRDFTSTGAAIDSFVMGYYNLTGTGVVITSDILMVNASFDGCGDSQFLYYVQYFTSLPFNCIPCNSLCKTCLANDLSQSAITDSNSCLSCTYLRYLNTTNSIFGNCPCYPGLSTINGECFPCSQNCLSFEVHFIQSTNQTNFLLYFSYPNIVQDIPLQENLLMYLNGRKIAFSYDKPRDAVYIISTELSQFSQCESATCEVQFLFLYPFKIMLSDRSKSLSMNNATIKIDNFVNYYTILPQQMQTAFTVLSMIVAGSYGSGLTSIVKILFELQQLIDAHKYLNLSMPIIYNQLIQGLSNFKFMDLTNLLPENIVSSIRGFPPNDLDQLGPPKMIYYDQGINFVKNIITGIISCIALLLFNFCIYWLLKLIPLKVTRKLSKKIQRRKIITIHDTLQQLELPIFIFAMAQLQFIYLKASLGWIYGVGMVLSAAALVAPFMVVLFIYQTRDRESQVQIYQDLMQDNNMSFAVTYIYYVFNYFRKIFFALCLTYSLPGLVQIYLLITLNTIHLAFQIYLVVAKIYRSKSKVLIRLINSLSVIIVQILIVVYNLNSYSNQTNINIGMACFYLSITTAILGLVDAFIKLVDTIFQEIKTKKVHTEKNSFEKKPVLKEFRNEIKCKLGQELKSKPEPKDPKQIKFIQDKELIENTFHNREDELQSDASGRISEADVTKSHVDDVDLVFIDDDWVNVYPPSRPQDLPSSQILADKKLAKNEQAEIELYEIPRSIHRQARKMRHQRREKLKKKSSKYDIEDEFVQIPTTSTKRYIHKEGQRLQIRPINQSKGQQEISQIDSSQL